MKCGDLMVEMTATLKGLNVKPVYKSFIFNAFRVVIRFYSIRRISSGVIQV
jgi:hypothetical protein